MASLLSAPFQLLRTAGESLRALLTFPASLEHTMRETNGLIADARVQLALLGEQLRRITEQLDQAAQDAQRQMMRTTEQLTATNRSLDQIVRLAEPFDRVGKRVAEGLQRVTGRRATPDKGSE
jgi:small-conductance mechanosensitive channel